MAVAEVQKINIVAHNNYKKQILELLYDKGFIEIIGAPKEDEDRGAGNKEEANSEYELAKVKYALEFLTPYFPNKISLLSKIAGEKPAFRQEEIEELKKSFPYIKISEQAENFGQRYNTLKSLIVKLEEEQKLLSSWTSLPIITETDLETRMTKATLGTVDLKKYDDLSKKFIERFKEAEIIKVQEDKNTQSLLLIYNKKYEKDLAPLLAANDFKSLELPALKATPQERLIEIDREISDANKEIKEIEDKSKELSGANLSNLQTLFDYLSWQLSKEQVQDDFSFTKSSFSILGWINKRSLPKLTNELKKITNSVEVVELDIDADEKPPVIMENKAFIRPFEFVTNIYGFPKHTEVDPTPFLAGFFILFFGLCLTDAGYGITLTIVSLLALKFLKVSKGFKKLLKVLFVGGIVTFVAGALTGGWFGIVLEELPLSLAWLSKPLIAIRQLDPVKEPLTMLMISLVLGYIHLFFGNAINLWWQIKNKAIKRGLIDSGVWMYFLLTIGLWVLSSQNIIANSFSKIALYLVYSSIAVIILTQGKGKNPLIRILGGLSALYFGITGYISDILSYSRLLALGLATGIIGMVINIVANMVYEMIPYVGIIGMVIVLIGGHIFNLIISLVGAFIHAGRLQYVEFFKMFFEGGGRDFNPFVRQSKYINLKK